MHAGNGRGARRLVHNDKVSKVARDESRRCGWRRATVPGLSGIVVDLVLNPFGLTFLPPAVRNRNWRRDSEDARMAIIRTRVGGGPGPGDTKGPAVNL